MLSLHDARRGEQAGGASDKDGLWVAVAEGLEFAQPSGEDRRDAVERKFGMNTQEALRFARGEMDVGVVAQAALEVGELFSGESEADCEGVAAEAGKEIGARLDSGEEGEAIDGAAGAVGDFSLGAVFDADDESGLGGALDYARGENANDAAMPTVAIDDEETVGNEFGAGRKLCFDDGQCGSFDVATFAIEALEFCGQLGGAMRIARGKELDHVGGDIHAAGGVDARSEAKCDVESGDLPGGWVERCGGEERAETSADGTAELTQAECGDGTILAVKRHSVGDGGDGRHFEKAGQGFFAQASGIAADWFRFLEQGLRELEGDGRSAERFFWIGAAGLIRIEDGEGGGERVFERPADGGR